MTKENKVYVTMTDRFMSGWGMSEGKTTKYIVICDSRAEAEIIERNAKKRREMKYINIRFTKPRYSSGYLMLFRNFNELGKRWKQ